MAIGIFKNEFYHKLKAILGKPGSGWIQFLRREPVSIGNQQYRLDDLFPFDNDKPHYHNLTNYRKIRLIDNLLTDNRNILSDKIIESVKKGLVTLLGNYYKISSPKELAKYFWTRWQEKFKYYRGVKHALFVFTFKADKKTQKQAALIDVLWQGMEDRTTEENVLARIAEIIKSTRSSVVNSVDNKLRVDRFIDQLAATLFRWNALKGNLQKYPGFHSPSIRIGNKTYHLNALWSKSQNDAQKSAFGDNLHSQLQPLIDDGITWGQIKAELDDADKDLWEDIRDELQSYPGNVFTDQIRVLQAGTTNSRGTFTINRLLTEKNSEYNDLSDIAKIQLRLLLAAGVVDGEIGTALTARNTSFLNDLWVVIQPLLSSYQNLHPTSITYNSQELTIDQLFVQKDHDRTSGSTISDTDVDGSSALSQLQALVNAGMTNGPQMQTALDTANTAFLTSLWEDIQDELQTYPGSVFTTQITVLKADGSGSRGTFTINHLLTEKNDNFTDLSTDAIAQLQALLNAKVVDGELGTALTLRNTSALNNLWNAIQPLLNNWSNIEPNLISFNSQSYDIDQLFVQKDHDRNSGSTISNSGTPSARSQLQTLVNAGMTTQTQMQTAITNANTILLTTLWGQIQDEFQAYSGSAFTDQIAVANKGRFTINHLLTEKDDDFIDLSTNAIAQLQSLLNAEVANGEIEASLPRVSSPTPRPPLPSITETKPATKSSTKKNNNQNLAIGLGTAGGVVALAGAGGFAYWFLKIRKS